MSDLFDGLMELAGDAVSKAVQVAADTAGTLLEGAGHAAGAAADPVSPVLSELAERAANYTFGGFKDPLQLAGEEALDDVLDFSETFEKDDRQQQAHEQHRQEVLHLLGETG
jgi:hypothetical protein